MAPTQYFNATCVEALASDFQSRTNFTACHIEPPSSFNFPKGNIVLLVFFILLFVIKFFMLGIECGTEKTIKTLRNDYHCYELHEELEQRYLSQLRGEKREVAEGRYQPATYVSANGTRTLTLVENYWKAPDINQRTEDWKTKSDERREKYARLKKQWEEKQRLRKLRKQGLAAAPATVDAPAPAVVEAEMEMKIQGGDIEAPPPAYFAGRDGATEIQVSGYTSDGPIIR